MRENLQQNLVDLSSLRLRPNGVSELPFHHAERSFDIRTTVVVSVERFLIQDEIGVKALPHWRTFAGSVAFERNVWMGSVRFNVSQIGIREIRFVGADFSHIEPFGGVVQQSGQHRRVVDIAGSDFNGYDDIRLDATHDVGLEPPSLRFFFAPLVVKPAIEPASRKPRAIGGELRFNRAKRCGAHFNKALDNRTQIGTGDVAINRDEYAIPDRRALYHWSGPEE